MSLYRDANPDAPLPESRRFSDRLRWLMEVHGDTCHRIERELGIAHNNARSYIRGDTEPKASRIVRIADYYGVTTDFLLGRTDKER